MRKRPWQAKHGGEYSRVRTYVRDLVVADLNQDSLLEEIISDEVRSPAQVA